ncbi:hypothetical protein [Streptomyces sp. NRRL S-87]|uniref:hypothetical protein n=1 Tax=Streptomyces sp. NRRL S-87 TaxID=1463920 RepID=UPI00131C19F0|nr:hypothetical protein [Streptomyces sp. NRRL S-87]
MRRAVRGVAAVLPLLLTATACAVAFGDGDGGRGADVYGKPFSQHFAAAIAATRAAGSLRFTSTLEYAGVTATARHVTEGRVDFRSGTAEALLTREVPVGFEDAADLDAPGVSYPQRLAVAGSEVRARGVDGGWLGYPPATRKALDPRGGAPASVHAPGPFLPYGGTLADLVARVRPHATPVVQPDGSREYRTTLTVGQAQTLLPHRIAYTGTGPGVMDLPVPLYVRLDEEGRLIGADADLAVLLDRVQHGPGTRFLKGVTRLRASFLASGFGEAGEVRPAPAADARKATASAFALPKGSCAVPAAGLADPARVRVVGCSARHTMRFFAAAGTADAGGVTASGYVSRTCEGPYRGLPHAWLEGAEPRYRNVMSVRSGSFRFSFDASGRTTGAPPKLALNVACYLSTPLRS